MTDNCSLFPDLAPSTEERIAQIDAEILNLLTGGSYGPARLRLSDDEKRVLRFIRYRRGAANAITIAEIIKASGGVPGVRELSDRAIKDHVRALRLQFSLPIGSNKGGVGGYFVMISPADRAILKSQILDQMRAEAEVLRATCGIRDTIEMLGQLRIEAEAWEAR